MSNLAEQKRAPEAQNQDSENNREKVGELLKKELTPHQFKWAVRLAVIGILAIGGIQKTYEYVADSKARAEVAQIIEALDCKKNKKGGKECGQCKKDELGNDYCGKFGEKALKKIPSGRGDENPIKVKRCGRKFKVRPFCLEQFDEVNDAMIAGTNGAECVQVNGSYRSTVEQWKIYKDFLDQEGDPNSEPPIPPETAESAIAKIREGVPGSVRLTGIVGLPGAGNWHSVCAFDVENWTHASKYFHQKGFQGGIDWSDKLSPKCGINKDLVHFSKGEFIMRSCVGQKLKQAGKWFENLLGL